MSQANKILALLSDGLPHSTVEILNSCYNLEDKGIARISARILELRRRGYLIEGKKDPNKRSIYWYQLHLPQEPQLTEQEKFDKLLQQAIL